MNRGLSARRCRDGVCLQNVLTSAQLKKMALSGGVKSDRSWAERSL